MITSFIIPVYNTTNYIDKCLLSIITQDLETSDYEIIIINDGSTDSSQHIIEKFKFEHQDINITLINQENRGLSAARNVGSALAKGEYIFFIDSDDFIFPNTLKELFGEAKKSGCDIIGFGWQWFLKSGKRITSPSIAKLHDKTLSGAEYLHNNNLISMACCHLFSSSFLKKHELSFQDGIYHEDELFTPIAFTLAQTVMFAEITVYAYVQRNNSITESYDAKSLNKRINDRVFILDNLLTFIKDNSLTPLQKKGLTRKINFLAVDMIINFIRWRTSKDVIVDTMNKLRKLNLFPIPKMYYSLKYVIFRLCFCNTHTINLAARLGAIR